MVTAAASTGPTRPTITASRAEPVVLPFAPARGWAEADGPRRAFAVALPVAVLVVAACALSPRPPQDVPGVLGALVSVVVLLAGPPMCYSAARVLRPHPRGVGGERLARHWASAVGTAYGLTVVLSLDALATTTPTRLWLLAAAGPVLLLEIVVAFPLGVVTITWGILAALWRLVGRLPQGSAPARLSGAPALRPDADDAG